MLWIALHFPQLSIDAFGGGHGQTLLQDLPLVIHDGKPQRPVLYAVNQAARAAGLQPGMALAAARAVTSKLTAVPRDIEKEQQALVQIATWLTQFSPSIALEAQAISIEISASLQLFGGIGALVTLMREGTRQLGYSSLIGVAPTALGAQLLARATQFAPNTRMCRDSALLAARLSMLPLTLFDWPDTLKHTLDTLGLTRIAQLQAMPRAGLQQRFGDVLVHDLDRAHGLRGDPRIYFALPDTFSSRREFVFELSNSDHLTPYVLSLFTEMEGFLRARSAGATSVQVRLSSGSKVNREIALAAREPTRHAKHWQRLLAEKFANAELTAPVIAVTVTVLVYAPYMAQTASLLADVGAPRSASANHVSYGKGESVANVMDRLAARLGDQAVYQIAAHEDHRPELAWQKSGLKNARQAKKDVINAPLYKPTTRPVWLLKEPRPLTVNANHPQYRGALTLMAGPERLDTGWWDGKPITRDYFIAKNPQHEVCWIYRDYRFGVASGQWYLHGFFG
jgi:protein ImuB